jgi:hypothetical protein
MNRQSSLFLLLLVSIIVFVVAVGVVLFGFLAPREEWVQVGVSADFPVSTTPYPLDAPPAFIVHLEGEWLVLSGHPPHPRFHDTCLIVWDLERERFLEPCGGAYFALDGRYLGGPSPGDMDRYAFQIRGEEIWVETTRLISGEPVPTAASGTPLPVTPP